MRGRFRWSSVFKILEPISLPPTDMLRPREKSTKARRKMGALSQCPTAAVAALSIIGCDLWWANLPPFQLTDDAVIGAGYSLPNASVMASYRRGRRNGCSSRRGYLIGLGHNADISAATGVPCHRPNIMERAQNRIVSTIMIGKSFWYCFCLCLSKSSCLTEWKTIFLASFMVGSPDQTRSYAHHQPKIKHFMGARVPTRSARCIVATSGLPQKLRQLGNVRRDQAHLSEKLAERVYARWR
jgi:hypothetical protein